jgi:WASH complex subunit strumpellin
MNLSIVWVCRNLLEIVDIQTNRMKPVPIKLEAVNLRDYAQLDERYLMAKLTHR